MDHFENENRVPARGSKGARRTGERGPGPAGFGATYEGASEALSRADAAGAAGGGGGEGRKAKAGVQGRGRGSEARRLEGDTEGRRFLGPYSCGALRAGCPPPPLLARWILTLQHRVNSSSVRQLFLSSLRVRLGAPPPSRRASVVCVVCARIECAREGVCEWESEGGAGDGRL